MIQSRASMSRYITYIAYRQTGRWEKKGWHFLVFLRKGISFHSAARDRFSVSNGEQARMNAMERILSSFFGSFPSSLTHKADIREPARRGYKNEIVHFMIP